MSYELKIEKFVGPLDKLLELIEEKKLDVTEISLARVTDDFLKYFKALTEIERDLRLVADFISVASRLILIKSKLLLPGLILTEDEEAGIRDLEKRLKIYQEFKPVLKILIKLWQAEEKAFSRSYFLSKGYFMDAGGIARRSLSGERPLIFYPGEGLKLNMLVDPIKNFFDTLKVEKVETETIKGKIISLEDKIKEIVKRIEHELQTNFSDLSNSKSRSEVVIVFIAILHLAREQLISLEQSSHFSDIMIRKSKQK